MKKKIIILLSLFTICLGLLFCFISLNNKNNKNENTFNENDYIISENEEYDRKDNDGNYIYDNIDGQDLPQYVLNVPEWSWEQQKNKCIVDLINKAKEKGAYSCYQNGFTYVLLTDGENEKASAFELNVITEQEDNVKIQYFIHESESTKANNDINCLFFRVPTNKEIVFEDVLPYQDLEVYTELVQKYIVINDLGQEILPDGMEMVDGVLYYNGEKVDYNNPPSIDLHQYGTPKSEVNTNEDPNKSENTEQADIDTESIENIENQENNNVTEEQETEGATENQENNPDNNQVNE